MPHTHPFLDRPYPQSMSPITKTPHRPSSPSAATSSVFLTPIQEQRILSWRTYATPPLSPLTNSLAPTPALTRAASPTTASGTASSRSARNPHSRLAGVGPTAGMVTPKVRSAPATLVTPSGVGSGVNQCNACGARCGCSTASQSTLPKPVGVLYSGTNIRHRPIIPGLQMSPRASTDMSPGQTGSSSRQRSYYSTKKYRQGKAMEMRQQSGFGGTETTATPNMDPWGGSKSRSALGKTTMPSIPNGAGGWEDDQIHVPGTGNIPKETEGDHAPTYIQPDWDEGQTQNVDPSFVPALPPPPPAAPRIGGARDPVSQQYWRNMYPPVGGLQGIHSGTPRPMMIGGMPGMMLHY